MNPTRVASGFVTGTIAVSTGIVTEAHALLIGITVTAIIMVTTEIIQMIAITINQRIIMVINLDTLAPITPAGPTRALRSDITAAMVTTRIITTALSTGTATLIDRKSVV